ncbi:hypothetical protein [Nocardiopsis ganjiahuensis]|uniref:hypothetical protein n=1 Tax=Nocardiopsis ganjiahuensis TaxID=239984 RepID=UPI000349B94B|nr:hypothetical protein [Nocardiopsis ganjiahuensis]
MSPHLEPVLELPDGTLTSIELDTFLHTWADYNGAETPRGLLQEEMTLFPGGLRAFGHGVTVDPGCCFGLEDWREWRWLLDREPIWMGHDPGVVQEFVGDEVHLSREGREQRVRIPLAELPRLLTGVREQLLVLLALVERKEGPEVAALLDRDLHVTDPLDLPFGA